MVLGSVFRSQVWLTYFGGQIMSIRRKMSGERRFVSLFARSVTKDGRMRWTSVLSEQLAHLTTSLGISYDELAQVLGTDRKTVYRWLTEESFPQAHNRERLDELEALVDRLDETFQTQAGSATWVHARSGYFGDLRPVDALLRGRIDAVHAALEALDSGVFV
jgi:hypothetical protein